MYDSLDKFVIHLIMKRNGGLACANVERIRSQKTPPKKEAGTVGRQPNLFVMLKRQTFPLKLWTLFTGEK